jgi:hypothetical protein
MRYSDLHWQLGRPPQTGKYLVFDRRTGTIDLAVVTGVRPLSFRTARADPADGWRFSAYLGPLEKQTHEEG